MFAPSLSGLERTIYCLNKSSKPGMLIFSAKVPRINHVNRAYPV
jgi:hypothetical protein